MMMNSRRPRTQAGVSLIEALVALAVMAFGMLGMVGMQATLRSNSDVAKQRAEAVRIGQASLERWRAFEQLDAGAGADFADINTGAAVTVAGTNATFTVNAVVNPAAAAVPASAPQFKTVAVSVAWSDRAGIAHTVNLTSTIAGIAPALAGALGLPDNRAATQRPRGRSQTIPATAVDQGNGTSTFTPPNSGGVSWIFNNTTGFITSVCAPATPCVPADRLLLTGYVLFATGGAPTPAEGEQPVDPLIPVGVEVETTVPAVATVACFTGNINTTAIAYYCAVPIAVAAPRTWSGKALVTGLTMATSLGDATPGRHKVCRYTPVTGCHPNVGDTLWGPTTPGGPLACSGAAPTPSRKMTNADHPLLYADVAVPLTQQNFLVISAGDGTSAFDCPLDGPLDFVNSTTYRHQPSS